MLEQARNFAPGKKTYTTFFLLLAIAIAGFFGLDLSPIADWIVPGEALPADILENVTTALQSIVALISALGAILRLLTKSEAPQVEA